MRRLALTVAAVAAAGAAAGCQSTQDKAAQLSESSSEAFTKKGLEVTQESKDVKVVRTWSLQDPNGTAVAVRLRNETNRRLVNVPVAIDVRDKQDASLFRNDAVGLDDSLVKVPLLRPGEELTWVNDQIVASGKPAEVDVKVGKEQRELTGKEPRITLQQIEQVDDVDGTTVTGFVMNKSDIDQRNLVIYAVATKGGTVVAAGRGQVPRVKPGKRARFNVYFIGNPNGAKLDLAVPATVVG